MKDCCENIQRVCGQCYVHDVRGKWLVIEILTSHTTIQNPSPRFTPLHNGEMNGLTWKNKASKNQYFNERLFLLCSGSWWLI